MPATLTPNLVLDFPVRMNECAPDGFMHSYVWFDFLQQAAAQHAEINGFGMTAIRENSFIWIVSRMKLQMESYPRYDDVVRVETYHNGVERLFAKRQFIMSSAVTGKRFGVASSFWLVLQLEGMKTRNPQDALGMEKDANADREDFFPMLHKLPALNQPELPMVHSVTASHIDLNDHLNNTFYTEYAMDWAAQKAQKIVRFKEFQINFNRAMMLGEKIEVAGMADGDNFAVEGVEQTTGKNSFQACGTLF